MKYTIFILLIVFLLSFEFIYCEDFGTQCIGSSSSSSRCKELLSEEEKLYDEHCCLFSGYIKGEYVSQCTILNKEEYEDTNLKISIYIDDGYTNVDIDCKSYYYNINIIIAFLFILL